MTCLPRCTNPSPGAHWSGSCVMAEDGRSGDPDRSRILLTQLLISGYRLLRLRREEPREPVVRGGPDRPCGAQRDDTADQRGEGDEQAMIAYGTQQGS